VTGVDLAQVAQDIAVLLNGLADAEQEWAPWLDAVCPEHRTSAVNLVHYWAIRQVDLRDLQDRLGALGLSSLGRAESHVEANLRAVQAALDALRGKPWQPAPAGAIGYGDGRRLLAHNAAELLGPPGPQSTVRIMVTLPSEAATDAELVARLIDNGMGIARINCAHDDAEAWRAMAGHIRAAATAAGKPCLIAMDLGGPKLRTGPLAPGPAVVRLRPVRDALGAATVPARGWLTAVNHPAPPPESGVTSIPVPGSWLRALSAGDVVELRDTRNSHRWLEVETVGAGGALISCEQTVYLGTGTMLHVVGTGASAAVGDLPPVEQFLRLRAGDILTLTKDLTPVQPDDEPARIGCTLPEVFGSAAVGNRILFDDGKIAGDITAVKPDHLDIVIRRPVHTEAKLRAAKGINLPDTDLGVSALTDKDLQDLIAVAELADIVEMSFVSNPADIVRLLTALDELEATETGIVLKIETRRAFENLPELALTAMRRPRVGVMIARGDLAVECGYERLAEVQEEILWLCEAGHLPVIWATQVLEQLAKTGLPSRAEISDAALGERAECVMLNKGPYIDDAVTVLRDIVTRMSGHHRKKNPLLRPLQSWAPVSG